MAGIFGIYAFEDIWNVSRFVYYGLLGLQHRGQEKAVISVSDGTITSLVGDGMVQESFSESSLASLKGNVGIGGVSTRDINGYVGRDIVIFVDGSLLVDENLAQRILEATQSKEELVELTKIFSKIEDAFTMLILTQDKIYAARDSLGLKPLCIGGIGFDLAVVSSESSALDVVGAEYSRDIKPGEVVVIDKYYIQSEQNNSNAKAHCGFEYVYFARPDSYINGIPIHEARYKIGELLARRNKVGADVVIAVPETSIPFAMAYSNVSGIPIDLGFVRTGRHTRTAIKPTQMERMIGVQLKLNPVSTAIRGKRVILIDDSVVRGTTTRNIVSLLRKKGAREVHVRIGSPKLISPCPFGTEVPPKDELIAVENNEEEIARIVGADTFAYLDIEDLKGCIKLPLCLGCFTGEYPEVTK